MIIGNIFQQFYSMVDAIVVGKFVGVDALAAIGATGSFNYLILGFVIGLTSGFSVIIAQRFGAGDEAGVKRATAMSVLLSAAITVIITAGQYAFDRACSGCHADPGKYYAGCLRIYVRYFWRNRGNIIF